MSATSECPRCRTAVRAHTRFCGNCGFPLHRSPSAAEPSSDRADGPRPQRPQGGRASRPAERPASPSAPAADDRALFRVTLEPREFTLEPGGEPARVEVGVYNLSGVIEEYVVDVVDNALGVRTDPADLRLLPNTDGAVELDVRIPGDRFVEAGTSTVHVEVRSHAAQARAVVEPVQVTVPESGGQVGMKLAPGLVRGARGGKVWLSITNPRNAPLRATLRGHDPAGALSFSFQPSVLEIPGGGSANAEARIAGGNRPFAGHERSQPFTIELEAGGTTTSASGTFVQSPVLTSGRRTALRVGLTVLGSLALIVGAFGVWTTAPAQRTGVSWTVPAHLDLVFGGRLPLRAPADYVPDMLMSAGLGTIVLGLVALLGLLGRGTLTLLAGGLAFVLIAGFLFALAVTGPFGLGLGALLCLAGALVACAGGLFGRR